MTTAIDYLKYSAKALWALVLPIAATFINDNKEWLANRTAGIVTGVLTAIVVWIQKNATKPS
jgi:branched-subunit amino acid transport protein